MVGGKKHAWSCHPIEHELSAYYDITHGLGLAIVTPRWMEDCLDETTVNKYVQFAVNVFGVDPSLDKMTIAKKGIEMLSDFFFNTLGIDDNLTKLNINNEYFPTMAKKVCKSNGVLNGFKKLVPADVEAILENCL